MASILVSFVNRGLCTLVVVTTLVNVVLRSLGVLACVVFPVLIVVTALSFVNVLPIALVVLACWELVIPGRGSVLGVRRLDRGHDHQLRGPCAHLPGRCVVPV